MNTNYKPETGKTEKKKLWLGKILLQMDNMCDLLLIKQT